MTGQADGGSAPELERGAFVGPVLPQIGDVVRFNTDETGLTGGGLLVDIRHARWWCDREPLRDETSSRDRVGYVAVLGTCWLVRAPLRFLSTVAKDAGGNILRELAA